MLRNKSLWLSVFLLMGPTLLAEEAEPGFLVEAAQAVEDAFENATEKVEKLVDAAGEVIDEKCEAAADEIETVVEATQEVIEHATEKAEEVVEVVGEALDNALEPAADAVEDAVAAVQEKIVGETQAEQSEEAVFEEEAVSVACDVETTEVVEEELSGVYKMLDDAIACFRKAWEYARSAKPMPRELAVELQAYTESEEIMDAVLVYAVQQNDVEAASAVLGLIRAEAYLQGAANDKSEWPSDDGDGEGVDSWDWSSDSGGSEEPSSDSEIGEANPAGWNKLVFGVAGLTAAAIFVAWYYDLFEQSSEADLANLGGISV